MLALALIIGCGSDPLDTGAVSGQDSAVPVVDTGCDTPETWFVDSDGDGHGDPDTRGTGCEVPSGVVFDGEDCDDSDAAVHPEATEVCDDADLDEDCDGLSDDSDPSVDLATLTAWYWDADGDGYFGPGGTSACEAPEGYGPETTDCDDTDPAVSPGAREICGDGRDNDCDGLEDETCLEAPDGSFFASGSGTSDEAGCAVATGADLDGDGIDDLVVGARLFSDGPKEPGAVYVLLGPLGSGAVSLDAADRFLVGEKNEDSYGGTLTLAPDLDGDGVAELIVGAAGVEGDGGHGAGALYLYRGLTPESGLAGDGADLVVYGEAGGDYLGSTRASGEQDLTGDGRPDLVVGSDDNDHSGGRAGSLFVMDLLEDGIVTTADSSAAIRGDEAYEELGGSHAVADLNGDGLADLVVGSRGEDLVSLVLGPLTGELSRSDADHHVTGREAGSDFGEALVAGDLDGDGHADLVIAAPLEGHADSPGGRLYGFTGPFGVSLSAADSTFEVRSTSPDYRLGYRLGPLAVADLDADGVQDLLVTSPQAAEDRGRTWVFTGPLTGSLATDRSQLRVTGAAPWDWLGSSLAVGELDGDGRPDLLIGADHAGPGQEGRVYGFFGADLEL